MGPNGVDLVDIKRFNALSRISIFPHYTNKKSKLTEAGAEVELV